MNSRTLLLALVFLSQSFNFALTLQPMLLTESGALLPIQAGLTLAVGSLLSGLLQPYIGNLLDQGRIKRGFSLVAISYVLGVFGYWNKAAPAWQLIASCLLLVMAGLTLRTIISMALIANCQGEERAEAASMRYLVSNAALAVSSSISLFAFAEWRAQLLLIDLGTSLCLAGGMLWHLKRNMKCSRPRASIRESKAVLMHAMRNHRSRIVGLSMVAVCFSANLTYLPLLFAKHGMANTDVSASILMANALIVMLAARPMRRLTRLWPAQRVGKIGTCLIAAGMCFGPLTSSMPWVIAGIVIWTLGEVIFIPWEQLQLFNCFDDASPGLASGAVSFLFSICQILAPVLSTALLALPDAAAAVILTSLPIAGYWIYRASVKPPKEQDPPYDHNQPQAA